MNDFGESIYKIYNNPFILTPIIISFYKNYYGNEKDILLSYLILPIVLEIDHLSEIKMINVKTPLSRFTKNKEFMAGFYDRFEHYQHITNLCLKYALECDYIKINQNLKVTVITDEILYTDPSLKKSLEISNNLHKVFKKINIVNIYQAFGIKKL
ncbi:three component ABC system middle component [Algoriphagus zhangzhouensis]|uniref:Uncharacterized protein n=1 Tax=Algoriphagus zhangzhouensis TaxID=1073327 RepID=A0A1M7ZAR8_9BACT|nr:three component ABC system middle component [Algoriphagus zhangzhouensis]TDY47033.1 hypothetical protein A8938_1485 [Algoriphagus zhangzhouensis]SHO62008.1 hypothetical protein SAMN04488108_1777 [Algoriphagus zhangzhouensis]